jgi:hypothetical protein
MSWDESKQKWSAKRKDCYDATRDTQLRGIEFRGEKCSTDGVSF